MNTVHNHLKPTVPDPGFPPWHYITTPQLARLCGVSMQSVYNWRVRGSGPLSFQDRAGRHWYRLADVLNWIERGKRSPDAIILEWIADRFPQLRPSLSLTRLPAITRMLDESGEVRRTRRPVGIAKSKFLSAA